MKHNSAPHIIDAIGEDYFTGVLKFTPRNLRHVRATGTFASQWYEEISKTCHEHGVSCPMSAFNMKRIDNKIGTSGGQNQDRDPKKGNGAVL
tara:strand:- start:1285 stop:1560 length:276 start_codon:yes stop_codon:yes gene_type:complete